MNYEEAVRTVFNEDKVRGVDYVTGIDAGTAEEEIPMSKTAYVSVPYGMSTVNLRERPNKKTAIIKRIRQGTVVEVLEQAEGWAKIVDPDGDKGYVMTEFLRFLEHADGDTSDQRENEQQTSETAEGSVTLTLPRSAAKALYDAFMKAGWE